MKSAIQWLQRLFTSDLVALLTGAVFYVAVIVLTWGVATFIGFREVFGMHFMTLLLIWSYSAISVVAAWSSLGTGAWHWRFLAACWTTLCIVTAFMGVEASQVIGAKSRPSQFALPAAIIFACSAFGGQWIASLGRVHIARERALPASRIPHPWQFNIATLLLLTAIVAAVLGAIRITQELVPVLKTVVAAKYDIDEFLAWVTVSCLLPLVAIPSVLCSWKTLLISVPGLALVVLAGTYWNGPYARPINSLPLIPFEALCLFVAAIIQLMWLRLCGFRLLRIGGQTEVNPART